MSIGPTLPLVSVLCRDYILSVLMPTQGGIMNMVISSKNDTRMVLTVISSPE